MTSKTYTIPELCKLLGIDDHNLVAVKIIQRAGLVYLLEHPDYNSDELQGQFLRNGIYEYKPILSVGDKLPSEECEKTVEITNEEIIAFCHTQGYDGKFDENISPQDIETAEDFEHLKSLQRKMFEEFDRRKKFKPLLHRVKSIRLVETCKTCGFMKEKHGGMVITKALPATIDNLSKITEIDESIKTPCGKFSPEQRVEIEVSK